MINKKVKTITKSLIILSLIILLFLPIFPFDFLKSAPYYGQLLFLDIPDFTFSSTKGKYLIHQHLKNKLTFLYFGYINCTPICSSKILYLEGIAKRVENLGLEDIQFVYITIDPTRDQHNINEYINSLNGNFTGLYSNLSQTQQFSRSFFAFYNKANFIKKEYDFDHNRSIYLIGPDLQTTIIYPFSYIEVNKVINDIKRLKEELL